MNDMGALKIKLASLWDELFCKAPESKRLVKRVISPSNEFIAEKRKKIRNLMVLIMNMVLRFISIRLTDIQGFGHIRAKQTIFHGDDSSFITSSTRLSRLECFDKLA